MPVDGEGVNIPPLRIVLRQMTASDSPLVSWFEAALHGNVRGQRTLRQSQWGRTDVLEKFCRAKQYGTVPQTDTGKWVEYTKVIEKIFAKELGNTASVPSV